MKEVCRAILLAAVSLPAGFREVIMLPPGFAKGITLTHLRQLALTPPQSVLTLLRKSLTHFMVATPAPAPLDIALESLVQSLVINEVGYYHFLVSSYGSEVCWSLD